MSLRNRATAFESLLKWATLLLAIAACVVIITMAVRISPPSGQAGQIESEILAKQIEFILKMNSAFLGFLSIIGALLTWFFKNSLDDAKKVTQEIVRSELAEHIQPLIQEESKYIKRLLKTEQIIGSTSVYYYIASKQFKEPLEYHLLNERGFRTRFFNQVKRPKRQLGNVLVIDVSNTDENENYLKAEDNSQAQDDSFKALEHLISNTLDDIIGNKTSDRMPVLVIYVRPGKKRVTLIDNLKSEFTEVKYYTSANTPVALMGWVVDSAYVAYSDHRMNHR